LLAVQESNDNTDGTPNTRYELLPFVMSEPDTFTVTVNANVLEDGVVEKVNVAPPLELNGEINDDAVDATAKSEDTPVEAPLLSDTEIVQVIALPVLCGVPAVQDKPEAVVGVP